jgi:hypothetical protein
MVAHHLSIISSMAHLPLNSSTVLLLLSSSTMLLPPNSSMALHLPLLKVKGKVLASWVYRYLLLLQHTQSLSFQATTLNSMLRGFEKQPRDSEQTKRPLSILSPR